MSYCCSARDCLCEAIYEHKGLSIYLCEDHASILSFRNCEYINEKKEEREKYIDPINERLF